MAFFRSAIDTLKVLVIALALVYGALSICLRATATTTLARMRFPVFCLSYLPNRI